MKFQIAPKIDGKATRLHVERVYNSDQIEHFKITGRNRSIVLQTNRMLFQARSLKHRKDQWKVIEGNIINTYALDKITEAIEGYLNGLV